VGDLLIAVGILILLAVYVTYWLISHAIQAFYGLLPGVRKRRREAERRWLEGLDKHQQERERQEQERQREEQARRKVIEDAKQQFEEAVMGGRFPSERILAILADCESGIATDPKEAVEELLYGRCSLNSMTFSHAVRLIKQRQRINERARKRREEGFGEPSGPVTKAKRLSCWACLRGARRKNWRTLTTGRSCSGTRYPGPDDPVFFDLEKLWACF